MANSNIPDDLRDDLTAYLDNEADLETRRRVEKRLRSDPAFRAEADALKTAWELLDRLPRPRPSARLTSRTVQQITAIRPAITPGTTALSRIRRFPWAMFAVVAVGLLAGWGLGGLLPHPHKVGSVDIEDPLLLRDLRVIDSLPLYIAVGSMEFLQSIDHLDRFGSEGPMQ